MKKEHLGLLLLAGYGAVLVAATAVLRYGWQYYTLPLMERPHHDLHALLKPGGLWGHGLGIIGSAMILLLLLYSARKRGVWGLRFGRMGTWLNVHILFGLAGPVLITLHTAFKFNGIVSISYYAMLAVMFSGIFGRYLYSQIPRSRAGDALTLRQMEEQDRALTRALVEQYGVAPEALRVLLQASGAHLASRKRGWRALVAIMANDLKRPWLLRKFESKLRAQNLRIPPATRRIILRMSRQKSLLMRKRAFLNSVDRIFQHWHVLHKPFAFVMITIMIIHVAVALTFGYRWIF